MSKILDMPIDDYHAHPALGRSVLDKIIRSPKHLKHYLSGTQGDTKAFAQGRLIHAAILEAEGFWERVCTYDGPVRRGKAWEQFQDENRGKQCITDDERHMVKAIQHSFAAKAMTKNILRGSQIEKSIFWSDKNTEISCKARPDFFGDGVVYDLKSSADAGDEGFTKSAYRFGYHRQAAWYLDAVRQTHGDAYASFGFVVIEKTPPYEIQVFLATPEFIEKGRQENAENLALFARCVEEDYWPGYPDSIQILDLPEWAK